MLTPPMLDNACLMSFTSCYVLSGLQDFQRENGEIAGVEGVRKGREGVSVASVRGARE